MKKTIALLLAAVVFTVYLFGCESVERKDSSEDKTQITYPIVSYLPHYDTGLDDRWVSVRFSNLDELRCARELLIENGVDISDEKRVGFDYRSDEYIVKYWFDGILTIDSAKLTSERDYYELEYDSATFECYLYFNAASAENLPSRIFIKGPHSYTYPHNMYGYVHSRITAVKGAKIPENIDTDKLVIEIPEIAEITPSSPPIVHKVTYEGEEIIRIISAVYWTEELFEKVKHTLVIY